ncbi:MAG: DUF4097 domain-containing protein [Candidatus Marinimicrobia bacterium]|nr:DUF4097 domain-containing protein [Candidatus Neomarinimicrobiota bacterium]MCF7922295.1 DUF4097 domain-containing protein [Candidatus Neomarinimicrobiota bacterium]
MRIKIFGFILLLIAGPGLMGAPPPENITVAAGTTYENDISTTINDIIIMNGAEVKGDLETTTGDIYLEANARVDKITTVSGNIYLDTGSQVDKTIDTESGTLRAREGSTIKGDVTTETGDVRADGATFEKDIRSRHGHISLKAGTHVDGDISILNRGHDANLPVVEIYLGEGVYVGGKVTASHVDDHVDLNMYEAQVDGQIDKVTMIGDDQDNEDDEDGDGEEQDGECGGRSAWSKSIQYHANDEVYKDGNAYKAKKTSTKKDPTSSKNSKYWTDLGDC